MKRLKFILIDDNENYRFALKTILINQYDAEIIAEASNAEEALKITNFFKADIILMDIMMPGKNGITLAKELLWAYNNNLKIIAITMHVDKVYLTTLIEVGFRGCIFKNDLVDQLNDCITAILAGSLFYPKSILLSYKSQK